MMEDQDRKLCAVLMPTRARFARCLKSVESLLNAEPKYNKEIEVLLRLDDDDPQLRDYTMQFQDSKHVRFLIGKSHGYCAFGIYCTELARMSNARYVMQWNDDVIMEGPWISGIKNCPDGNHWMQCEWHKLGGSRYHKDDGAPFVILPNGYWTILGLDAMPINGTDVASINGLKEKGWKCHFLEGVAFHHQRDNDEALEAHRKH